MGSADDRRFEVLRAIVADFVARRHRGARLKRGQAGPEGERHRAQRDHCAQTAEPAAAADIFGEVRHEIEPVEPDGRAQLPFIIAFAPPAHASEHLALDLLRAGWRCKRFGFAEIGRKLARGCGVYTARRNAFGNPYERAFAGVIPDILARPGIFAR